MTDIKHEIALQRRFTDLIRGKGPDSASRRHRIYGKLLYYRFEEVIQNAFGRLKQYMSENEWRDLIRAFIKEGGDSPYIWRLPDAFRRFAAKKISLPFAKDMMWFEWIEIELLMQTPPKKTSSKPEMKARYTLSKTARAKKLAYRVFERDDDTKFRHAGKSSSYVLVYLDPYKDQVMYLEITEFMYKLLKSLKKSTSLNAALQKLSKKYGQKNSEVKAIIQPALENFVRLGILKQK